MDDRPVGIFDSGVGGLTVAKEIYRELPGESTVYLGDTARVPYGTRGKETVLRFAFEDAEFLQSKEVKAIVIACNTASALAGTELQDRLELPIIEVVEPAVVEAYKTTRNGRIGIIGTLGTIGSGAHEKLLKSLDPALTVVTQACPLLVPVIEDGRLKGPFIENLVAEYLGPLRERNIDTLILGCTHYPLIEPVIYDYLWERVKLVHPGKAVAKELVKVLGEREAKTAKKTSSHQYFVTDDSLHFRQTAEQFLGEPIQELQKVNLESVIGESKASVT